jgi:hypothetical protein
MPIPTEAGRTKGGAMPKTATTRNPELARWLEIVGASGEGRRSTLPESQPVYRI